MRVVIGQQKILISIKALNPTRVTESKDHTSSFSVGLVLNNSKQSIKIYMRVITNNIYTSF
jgi:hypothetical protein